MSDGARLQAFLEFSSELTAFSVYDLSGAGVVEDFVQAIDDIVGPAVLNEVLDAYAKILLRAGQSAARDRKPLISREILGDPKLGPVARNIIKLWYVGTWYTLPQAWGERFGPIPKDRTFVVSPASYIEGLMWKAIGAHPAGARAPGYGSWAHPPQIPAFDGDPAQN